MGFIQVFVKSWSYSGRSHFHKPHFYYSRSFFQCDGPEFRKWYCIFSSGLYSICRPYQLHVSSLTFSIDFVSVRQGGGSKVGRKKGKKSEIKKSRLSNIPSQFSVLHAMPHAMYTLYLFCKSRIKSSEDRVCESQCTMSLSLDSSAKIIVDVYVSMGMASRFL
jgi:hypothetical protein